MNERPARRRRCAGIAGMLAAFAVGPGNAQQPSALGTRTGRPFVIGERLTYDVEFGPLKVGTGTMEVRGVETVRGREAYHTIFRIEGGIPLYRVDDTFESWFTTDDLSSLRFHQDQNEGQKDRDRRYEIFPERSVYNETTGDNGEQPSVAQPLDDGSFDAIVIQPIIKTKGVFSEEGRAELWLSDDERRLMLQMKSRLTFGSIN